MKNVLILGKGYIGNYLKSFLEAKHHVQIYSKNELDYTNPNVIKSHIKNAEKYPYKLFDWVINCSGFTGTPNVEGCEDYKEECYHYNVTVPLQITKAYNQLEIPVIHIGSGCIYNGYDKIYSENDESNFGADSYESSFYSKTKDAFEKLSSKMNRYIFRIRIPFNGVVEPKNYLFKVFTYNNLISKQNSITCVDDLMQFIEYFIERKPEYGVYNVVNEGSVDGFEVVEMLKKKGISNPNWKFCSIEEMKFKVNRSNCILSTEKIKELGLQLPNVKESLERSVEQFANHMLIKDLQSINIPEL